MAKKRRVARPDKTNAARLLERLGIQYELATYEIGDGHLSAEEVARAVGQPLEQVFKTLVARGDRNGPLFAVVPATSELDLKALARASGDRSVAMVPLKEVTALTGYVRGGTTALAAKKAFAVYLDASAQTLPRLIVSAGQRGLQLLLSPNDYIRATSATLAPLSHR
ncbi:MAG: Cys-tRNA(Pro) deacylase [Myxococcales bacterium]|nr:Cys-tRNA(Pro) deacylase [Myxococcales bacterium]